MGKTLLSLIGVDKREEEKSRLIYPSDDVLKSKEVTYALDTFFTQSVINDKPDINVESKPVLEVGASYIEDLIELNYFLPKTFDLFSIDYNDVSVLGTPTILQIAEPAYQKMIDCNFYANRDYELFGIEDCSPQSLQIVNYQSYVEGLIRNTNILFDALAIFTGNKSPDTPLGTIGAKALNAHFRINLKENVSQIFASYIEEDPYRILNGDSLTKYPYNITTTDTFLGKVSEFTQKLSGFYNPFLSIPDDVFDLERKSEYSRTYSNSLLMKYTGDGQKKQLQTLLNVNKYRPLIDDKNFGVNENNYVYMGDNGPMPFTDEFNSEFGEIDSLSKDFFDKNGQHYKFSKTLSSFASDSYGASTISKQTVNNELMSLYYDLDRTSDESNTNLVWNKNTKNLFLEKTLLHKTKEIVNNNSENVFINSSDKEFKFTQDNIEHTISRGSAITAYADWEDNGDGLDYQIKNGDFFRVWTKDRKYSKLNRTQKHKGLDNGDSRSVLGSNGLVNIAPTVRSLNGTNINKYMFSIENLAWADNIADLPDCEIGQGDLLSGHRGRIMWFPPYGLTFNESVNVDHNSHAFIGRGEKIYTYNNTERSGTLSFKLLIDHPSIINNLRGQRTELWERYFKGDKSAEKKANSLIKNKLTTAEIQELEGLRQSIQPKIVDTIVKPKAEIEQIKVDENSKKIETFDLKFMSVYFPNNVDTLPTLNGGAANNAGYQSKLQADGLDYTYFNGIKRDEIYAKKTGRGAYPNKHNYLVNNDFFNEDVLNYQFKILFDKIKELKPKVVTVCSVGYATQAIPINTTNQKLSTNRCNALRLWFEKKFEEFKKTTDVGDVRLDTSTIMPMGDQKSDNTGKDADIDSKNSVDFRRADLLIKIVADSGTTISKPKSITEVLPDDNLNQNAAIEPTFNISSLPISNTLLNKLLDIGECDIYEYIETNAPFIQHTISEKVKYFNPAFHSMTPQGFNSRLNFLHQCTRQGQSIGVDGIDNLTNFAFGRPPICILKIGDFYHTKIFITSLNISYNETPTWDLNPESGAGVQPMIADISMNFLYLGGQSISGPINRLQNALSFNYYANTEMYDPRADSITVLEDSKSNNSARILDGFKLSNLIEKSDLIGVAESKIDNIKGQYGNLLPNQKINPNSFGTLNTVPSDINTVNNLIQLKSALGLPLTEQERLNLLLNPLNPDNFSEVPSNNINV